MDGVALSLAGGEAVQVYDGIFGLGFRGIIGPYDPRFVVGFQLVPGFSVPNITLEGCGSRGHDGHIFTIYRCGRTWAEQINNE
jgi:hypothetical protein